ncbi:hypothetical protein TYRP_020242 [Tyrophagus putrescentiae]|nr:hypothetical protein TYRP_020242 [Tyrophagus putrescentiae]
MEEDDLAVSESSHHEGTESVRDGLLDELHHQRSPLPSPPSHRSPQSFSSSVSLLSPPQSPHPKSSSPATAAAAATKNRYSVTHSGRKVRSKAAAAAAAAAQLKDKSGKTKRLFAPATYYPSGYSPVFGRRLSTAAAAATRASTADKQKTKSQSKLGTAKSKSKSKPKSSARPRWSPPLVLVPTFQSYHSALPPPPLPRSTVPLLTRYHWQVKRVTAGNRL